MEVLITVAILMLLATLLLPVLQSAKEGGKHSRCIQNQKQLYYAVGLYAVDYADHLPFGPGRIAKGLAEEGFVVVGDPFTDLKMQLPDVNTLLSFYGSRDDLWRCPVDRFGLGQAMDRLPTYFDEYGSSYVYDAFEAFALRSLTEIESPSALIMIADAEAFHRRRVSMPQLTDRASALMFDGSVRQLTVPDYERFRSTGLNAYH